LAEHTRDRIRRQDAGGQLDLSPGERPAELVPRFGCGDHVRFFADVHYERVAVEPHNRVE
jgi:hypothetical protein